MQNREGARTLPAPHVVLAAGTLASTARVFNRLCHLDKPVPLLNNPVAAAAFMVPGMFARALPEESFSLAQIFYQVKLPGGDAAAGALYGADALPLDVFAARMPFTRPTALRFARLLAPALVLATCYLPSGYSRNTITVGWNGTVEWHNDRPRLAIVGEITPAARTALKIAKRGLARGLRRLGALPLPGGFAIGTPGSDQHYAGTVPMLPDGDRRTTPSCNRNGEVSGAPGLFVVDGAALPALPAKHATLTIMANADRIGRRLASCVYQRHMTLGTADRAMDRCVNGHRLKWYVFVVGGGRRPKAPVTFREGLTMQILAQSRVRESAAGAGKHDIERIGSVWAVANGGRLRVAIIDPTWIVDRIYRLRQSLGKPCEFNIDYPRSGALK